MPQVEQTNVEGVIQFWPDRFGDERGYFSEVFNRRVFSEQIASNIEFCQDNESYSSTVGTIRGLHFQTHQHAQAKLVRAISGRLLDVAVDLRLSSPTFGFHVAVELDSTTGNQLWIPAGFAHGFCTLEPDTVIGYKASGYYQPDSDRSLAWDEAELGIAWPDVANLDTLSSKDAQASRLGELRANGDLYD